MATPPPPATPRRASLLDNRQRGASAPPEETPPKAPATPAVAPAVLRQLEAEVQHQQQFAALLRGRQFRDLRFRLNNYFEYNRRGLVSDYQLLGEQPWDDALMDPSKALAPYNPPKRGEDWNELYIPFGTDDEGIRAQQAANSLPFAPPEPGFIRPRTDTGDAFVIDLRDKLRARNLDIRSLRHLGAGAAGLATLFEVRSSRMGVRKKFVVKSSRKGEEASIQFEKIFLQTLKRAPHIIQGLSWAEDIFAGAPLAQNAQSFCQAMDARTDLIYLEYMKGGNLAHLIGKAVAAGAAFPTGVLWKVFFCLVRACLAMEYPPRLFITENGDYAWDSETGEDVIERVPDNEHYRRDGYGIVHFDLDPNNVLIGNNDVKHPAVPAFKVCDFSHSAIPRDVNLANRDALWLTRRAGKRRHYMPEQFHKEWEYVRNLPKDEFPAPKVAGNFGPTSNIWAIGMVLHDMITQNLPPDPPAAFGPMNGPDDTLMPEGISIFRDVNGNAVDPFYTHGSWLRDADINDNVLKGLLIRCLADQPAHRPTLIELETYLTKADKIIAWNDDPDDREWFEQMVHEAPDANDMVDPVLDLPGMADQVARDPGLPAVNNMSNRQSSRLAFVSRVLRTQPWPRRRPAAQASRAPEAAQDGPQATGSRFSQLISAAGASLQALTGIFPRAPAEQPVRAVQEPQDTSAWMFNSNGDTLYLNSRGLAVLPPVADAALDPAQVADERAAGPLPTTPVRPRMGPYGAVGTNSTANPSPSSTLLSTPIRPRRGPCQCGAVTPNSTANPSPFSTLSGSLNRTRDTSMSPALQSNAYLSERGERDRSTVSPENEVVPDIFLIGRDPATLDGNGQPLGIQEGFVMPLTEGLRPRHVIPIPAFSPGMAPRLPAGGYRYGRAVPSSPVIGQDVPVGSFTIRMEAADPAGGPAPNVFFRDLNWAPLGPPAGGNLIDNNFPQLGEREGQGPWLPRVRAVRIPPYGLFERPPPRPMGYRYGRRLHISAAELGRLADRGIRASPGRRIIRLVHVHVPRGANYERPTIFYQMQPRARAPRPPSDDDPNPTVLYCTLPDS